LLKGEFLYSDGNLNWAIGRVGYCILAGSFLLRL